MTKAEVLSTLLDARQHSALPDTLEQLSPWLDDAVVLDLKQQVDAEKLKNASRALRLADLTRQVAERVATPLALARASWALGNALAHLTRYREALEHYQSAEATLGEAASLKEQVALRINAVAMLEELGEYAPAITLAEATRPLCLALGNAGDIPLTALEMNLGAAYEQQGELRAALSAFQRGETLARHLGDAVMAARLSVNQANVLKQQDRFEQAAVRLGDARAILAGAELTQEVARVDLNLGRLAFRRGRYQEALRHLSLARIEFSGIPNPSEVAVVELHQAQIYRTLNLANETLSLAEAACIRFEQDNTRFLMAQAKALMGSAFWKLGALEQADTHFQAAKALFSPHAPYRVLELEIERALLALDAGHAAVARTRAEAILLESNGADSSRELPPFLLARCRLVLSRAALESPLPDPAQALEHARQGLQLTQTHDLLELSSALHAQLGRALERLGQAPSALSHLHLALEALEKLRSLLTLDELQLGYMDDKLTVYEDTARLSLHAGQLPAVLEVLNTSLGGRLRTRALAEPSTCTDAATQAARTQGIELELERLRETWQWFQRGLEDPPPHADSEDRPMARATATLPARQAVEAAIGELLRQRDVQRSEEARKYAAAEPSPPWRGTPPARAPLAQTLREHLLPGEALVHFYFLEGRMHVLSVSHSGLHAWHVPATLAGMRRWQRAWRLQVEGGELHRGTGTVRALLQKLWLELLSGLEDHLPELERLFVVLPPQLHDLPLAAALGPRGYLIAQVEVIHLSAPEALLSRLQAPPGWNSGETTCPQAHVLAHSDGGRLHAALEEARHVGDALQPRFHLTVALEAAATSDALKTACTQAQLLHLATHATFRPDNPFFSWIRLHDARMTVAEVYDLSLPRAPLVVLSACETGRGEARGGGLLGLGRALLAAGASGLILSRWQVVDNETAQLMRSFYQGLERLGPVEAASALATAQRQAIHALQDPRHWSAFLFMQG